MNNLSNNKRIARNTAFLYFRMLISMIISFFTAGIVLNTLGVVDYGINNVVGGLVSMFTVISSSLSAASSRFITFELGRKDGNPRKIFSTSVQIHILLAFIVFILLETVGLWFLNYKLVIPYERLNAAFWVYQFSLLSTMLNIVSIPFVADILANERMNAFAYIGILDSILRLLILFLLLICGFDKLILYAVLQFIVVVVVFIIYYIYCRFHFNESRLIWKLDFLLAKKMVSFSGWNFIGASSALLRDQGVNMILNIFCGPAINAARGIGVSVNGIVSGFGTNLLGAINPQITKHYANNNIDYSVLLVMRASRYAFLLLFLVVFPILIRTEILLEIWLRNIPDHAVLFTKLTLLFALVEIISNPLITLMLATGDIKWYQILVGGAQLLNLPLSYLCLWLGSIPELTMGIAVMISLVCLILRLIMLHRVISLNIGQFVREVILKVLLVVCCSVFFYLSTNKYFDTNLFQSIEYIILCTFVNIAIVFVVGMKSNERIILLKYIASRIKIK